MFRVRSYRHFYYKVCYKLFMLIDMNTGVWIFPNFSVVYLSVGNKLESPAQ